MMSIDEREDDGGVATVRAKVLLALLLSFSVGACIVAALVAVQAIADGVFAPTLIVGVVAAALLMLLVAIHRYLSYRATAVAFVVHVALVATYLQCFHGLSPSTALATVAYLLLSAMFLGLRTMAWVLLLALLSLTGSALVVTQGWVEPWPAELWDPHRSVVWFRYLIVLLFLGGGLAMALAYLVQGLHDAAQRLAAIRRLERIERERRESVQLALERSKRMESMAHFAAGLAHDFNNSLVVILALAHRIESDSRAPAQLTSTAGEIRQSVEVAADTVRGLLSFGRADTSQPRRIRLDRLLRRAELGLRAIFPEDVRVTIAAGPAVWVLVDVVRCQQAILNLAVNARDAMPEGGVFSVAVSEETCEEVPPGWNAGPGPYLVVSCTDSGVGMDSTTLEKAFEPFFTTKGPSRGTGLGLASVHALVHDSHGFVELHSVRGEGTEVKLYLPKPEQHIAVVETWE